MSYRRHLFFAYESTPYETAFSMRNTVSRIEKNCGSAPWAISHGKSAFRDHRTGAAGVRGHHSRALKPSPTPDSPAARYAAWACLALSMSLVGSYVALSKPLAA